MKVPSLDAPCRIFIVYAREDQNYLDELMQHLRMLEKRNLVHVWHDQFIDPGQQWEKEITDKLDEAEIVLILVSPDYYMSEYIQKTEIVRAVQKHKDGDAIVIPLFVRHCAWREDEIISSLQGLPDGDAPLAGCDKNAREKFYSQTIVDKIKGVSDEIKLIRQRKIQQIEEERKRKEMEKRRSEEEAKWAGVCKSNTIPAYRAFLSEYPDPDGAYYQKASDLLKKLEYDETRKKEDHSWSEAIAQHTEMAYQNYLNDYPNGIYTNIAKVRAGVFQTLAESASSGSPVHGYFWLKTAVASIIFFSMGVLFQRQYNPSSPSIPKTAVEEDWKHTVERSSLPGYKQFLARHNDPSYEVRALDSVYAIQGRLQQYLMDGVYYYGAGKFDWAKDEFIKAYQIDSFNEKTIEYLKKLDK